MKVPNIYQVSCTSLLAISLAIIPFTTPGQAQTNPDVAVVETEDNDFDWGLLGLLGLIGLAGLAGKNKHQDTHRDVRGTEPFPEAPANRTDSEYR